MSKMSRFEVLQSTANFLEKYGKPYQAEMLRNVLDQHKFMTEQIDKLNTEMPCGHLAQYQATTENGTQYCCLCTIQTMMEKE